MLDEWVEIAEIDLAALTLYVESLTKALGDTVDATGTHLIEIRRKQIDRLERVQRRQGELFKALHRKE